jgi:outer membrane protein assembly factor BamD (BamD/ComL family)
MNALRLILVLFCLATFVACDDSKSKSLEKIEKLEKQLLDANGNPKDEVSAYNLQVEYDDFATRFPDDPKAPEALFFLGFVYDNQINDDTKAGTYYNDFLKKYPKHVLAKDVEASIRNLGKTDEELIREFERMNGDSARKDSAS